MDIAGATGPVRCRKYPYMAVVIDGNHRVVMGIGGILVQQDRRLRHCAGGVVVAGDHVHEMPVIVGCRSPVAKKRLVHFSAVNSKRLMLGTIRA